MSGFDVIRGIRGAGASVPIIMITGHGSEQAATEAIRLGASDYISKPVHATEIVSRTRRNLKGRTNAGSADGNDFTRTHNLLWQDPAMKEVADKIHRVASTNSRVLISGETGTGKQLVARAIHSLSNRCNEPIVELNCAAVPENLLESELFGHEKGAFTGASERWGGRCEEAGKGTLFLDEIGELSYGVQSKLLHLLQDGRYTRIGGKGSLKSEARVLSATNQDLQSEVEAGRFRADLFYRPLVGRRREWLAERVHAKVR